MPLAPRVDTCLRIMQRRAALLGLDAPSKTNVELDGAMRVHNECAPAISEKEAERRILEIVEQARKRELERPSGGVTAARAAAVQAEHEQTARAC
jgi:hypothetical protein